MKQHLKLYANHDPKWILVVHYIIERLIYRGTFCNWLNFVEG